MSKAPQLPGTNPFAPIKVGKPVHTVTKFDGDEVKYIIERAPVKRVVITGDNDTDFIVVEKVEEVSRVLRDDYINSYDGDVGILNILRKVRMSGDVSLLNQTGRVSLPGTDVDSLGRPVEDVADYTQYNIDRVDAFEAYKKGVEAVKDLPEEIKNGKGFEALAKLSDAEVQGLIDALSERLAAPIEKKEGNE